MTETLLGHSLKTYSGFKIIKLIANHAVILGGKYYILHRILSLMR